MVSYETAVDSLRNAPGCCESNAQFSYEPLVEGEGVRFPLDASSDAFDFPSGKSYFKAFRLPASALPYRIRVTSFALGEHIRNAHVFYPQIALLDEGFTVIRQSAPGDFAMRKAGLGETAAETWGLPVKIEGSVLVDNPRAKYLVVYTTEERLRSATAYATMRIVPIILPGVVTALPAGREQVLIRHSPFGLLHVEVVRAEAGTCPREADIEPQDAITDRFVGRDARLFIAAVEPTADATRFDVVVILRGAEVLGGTVAVVVVDGCLAGRKFLSGLEYIHAVQMLALYRNDPALRESDRLEFATLQAMADAGNTTAQFHVGLAHAWGRGVPASRRTSIVWLTQAAQRGFGPAMLALGMALSGPGAIRDEVQPVGRPPRTDGYTDLVTAYAWLDAASRSGERDVEIEAAFRLRELVGRMSPEELRKARAMARELSPASHR